ncbi:histone deacetylase 5 [Selaginella moellendorffii]|uniref:histone deacetylase 5 n=1 Tax=Selaginella moellendorffii TaxID=88036 RepID=UPI000D1CD6C6|nr:histone deacetylase 5 [Selaginella moellendorffii]|eukprot:XP_024540177.1 histone deacetylase 5 [Selaginella moellendorffii]
MAVGLVYDRRMCAHRDPFNKLHPEQPARITAIWKRLEDAGVLDRCVRVDARPATAEELATVHTDRHIEKMSSVSSRAYGKEGRAALARRYNSIYFNDGSSESALLAAGSVVELSLKVARGELASAAAIVRPPGHHAEADEAMGFCLFNNVAVAAQILSSGKVAGSHKVLIVDWDVHHGNGTQNMFWQDPNVLYFSVHRYDDGYFYPGGQEGNFDKVGGGAGAGFNINVPWPRGGYSDADYVAVWEHVLMPVAREFNPDIVLISGGFDSARGDPLGGCKLTPLGYSIMTQELMQLAGGKIVLALEGGYNLESIAESYLACVQVLLGDIQSERHDIERAYESTWTIIDKVRQELCQYWPVLREKIEMPASRSSPPKEYEFEEESEEEVEEELEIPKLSFDEKVVVTTEISNTTGHGELVKAFERLTTEADAVEETHDGEVFVRSETVEIVQISVSSEVSSPHSPSPYIWYATYGSNMWPARLMCYIQGGKVEGIEVPGQGLLEKTPPLEDFWLSAPHRLFFGRERSLSWGNGGVAFLNPVPSDGDNCHLRAYKITLEQFNGILAQENRLDSMAASGLVSPSHFETLKSSPHIVDFIENAWYGSVLYLGDKNGAPILTITCSQRDAKRFECGELPTRAPSVAYQNTLINGLLEKGDLSHEQILAYVTSRAPRS